MDDLISEREQIKLRITKHMEKQVKDWGLRVDSLRLQDIELSEDLKRMMSRQSSAEAAQIMPKSSISIQL